MCCNLYCSNHCIGGDRMLFLIAGVVILAILAAAEVAANIAIGKVKKLYQK